MVVRLCEMNSSVEDHVYSHVLWHSFWCCESNSEVDLRTWRECHQDINLFIQFICSRSHDLRHC